ncbi:colicin-like pore-forming protein [Pantoea sp.]|uniref:colicin-like pore-forming protein n=1 Tax=Pantoea sp. TaxID=69393 RepID=UPI0028A1624A|nr:colicin-like pore-forming protein [Pantoea sp.]
MRNRAQALQAFNRYKDVLNKKFSAADRLAIANALSSLSAEKMSQQVKLYGKAFGVVGDYIQYSGLVKGLHKGFTTGDWNDAIVSAEGIVISKAAGALAAFAFAAMTTSALGILGFTMIMVLMGALISDQLIKQINDFMLSL